MKANDKKICFIACVNNSQIWEECLMYLNRLIIPDGFEVDILSIMDAKSMTSGYNEGMMATDAKYKIYIHQDTFITDIFFLQELIDVFLLDERIGMVGMVGALNMPPDGIMWNGERVFSIYCKYNLDIERCKEYTRPTRENVIVVDAIDGLLMATQYDLKWREDLFTEWDFYDASQSLEYKKKGYYVVVPKLDKPMCVHDDGVILHLDRYEDNRVKFVETYGNMLQNE